MSPLLAADELSGHRRGGHPGLVREIVIEAETARDSAKEASEDQDQDDDGEEAEEAPLARRSQFIKLKNKFNTRTENVSCKSQASLAVFAVQPSPLILAVECRQNKLESASSRAANLLLVVPNRLDRSS